MTRTILVIRLGSLGDVILTSAPVLNLRLSYPDSRIVFLTRERFRPVVEMFGTVDEIITVSDQPGFDELGKLILSLDDRNLDTIIDLHGNIRSWLIRRVTSANRKLSYPKRRRERLRLARSHCIPDSWPGTVDLYNHAIADLGGLTAVKRPLLRPNDLSTEFSDLPSTRLVVIAPGAAHPNKQWPIERFAQVAAKLHQEHECHILWVVTGEDDTKLDLTSYFPSGGFTRLIDRPAAELAPLISRAHLTIANDSGIAHLSTAVGTPTLAVFGPTHPALGFAPRGIFDEVIEVQEPCRPCSLHGRRPCFREQRFCFTRITPDDVAARARAILTGYNPEGRALILDRDGTMIVNKHYLSDPEGVQLEATVLEALTIAKQHGWKIVVISNQSGVARGLFSVEQVERVNARMLQLLAAQGVRIDGVWFCPHHPTEGTVPEHSVSCNCRKPGSGMVDEAARTLGFNPRRSVVVGDHLDDYLLGRGIGAQSLLVRTGHGRATEEDMTRRGFATQGIVFPNLLAAVNSLIPQV
jgi:heptosyltransferase-2